MKVTRIGRELAENGLPLLGPVTREDDKWLSDIDALVGMDTSDKRLMMETADGEGEARDGSAKTPIADERSSKSMERVQLALAREGLITRWVASKETKDLKSRK